MIEELSKYFLLPSNIFMFLLILLFIVAYYGNRKLTTILSSVCFAIYFILGSGPVSHYLLSKLEYSYPVFKLSDLGNQPDTIVILTGSGEVKPMTPSSSQINAASAFRLLEARHIQNLLPNSSIVISGYGNVPELMKQVLVSMGIAGKSIELDSDSPSTYDSATKLSARLKDRPFVLVTSAGHMPRSMGAFRAQGLDPIPAPTDYLSRKNILAAQYLPTPRHWVYTDLAIHEYLAILWYKITGKM